MRQRSCTPVILLVLCAVLGNSRIEHASAQGQPPRVALILDDHSQRFEPILAIVRQELTGFFRPGQIELLQPRVGDGTAAGITALVNDAFRDPSVSVVITLGTIGSHLLARTRPPKPAIAALVIDAGWQGLPRHEEASGVARLTYVDQSYPIGETLADFHHLIPFSRMAVILDRPVLAAIPELNAHVTELIRNIGAEAVMIPADSTASDLLDQLPADVDAVYLAPLGRFSSAELSALLARLAARRLVTLSYSTEPEVTLGALASYEPSEHWHRRARRIAVDLQRILAGEDAGTLPVGLVSAPHLTLNLATARAVGYAPGWSVLTDADLVGADSVGPSDTVSLGGAMRSAVEANLDLRAAELGVQSGYENVLLARSNLLPQLDSRLTQTYTREETAAASFGQQPERQLEGGLTLSMSLYSDRAWAGYTSEKHVQQGREATRDQQRLDVALDAATAYLDVLRARTLAEVQRANLRATRSNLEVARLRERVGSAGRADVFRWQGEEATARRDLIEAEARVRIAALEFKRVLNRPLELPLAQRPVSLSDEALLVGDTTALAWLDDPGRSLALTDFLLAEAYTLSPELTRVDALMAAQRRQYTSAGRAFWLPSLNLQGGLVNQFSSGGAGSAIQSPVPGLIPQPEDLSWQFKLQASLPLFTGFANTSTRAQTGLDLDRLGIQRQTIRQAIDQQVRASLEAATASYAAIALARDAADASLRNFALVSDAYAEGTASITALIDAQSAALTSAVSAANAVHNFLIDLMRVERAVGAFGSLQSPAEREQFRERLRTFIRERAH